MSKTYITAALRQLVYERAQGCCEYCLIPDVATLLYSLCPRRLRNCGSV